jgi:tryptophan halogenase
MNAHNIIVVGGGTAGIMTASYIKAYWGPRVNVTVVYDHKNPGIGVGESLTPTFDTYLKRVGITTQDLIENCHATIKLGLKIKNWKLGTIGYHSFPINQNIEHLTPTDIDFMLPEAQELLNENYNHGIAYSKYFFENNNIPSNDLNSFRHALHIDANKLGRYIEWRYKDHLNIVDGVVDTVETKNNSISSLKLKSGEIITGDLFIDCSGYQRILLTQLTDSWVDISKELPTNRTIPNPLFKDFKNVPVYTTAEASKNGWILDVPLSNRHGTGYVYSSEFTTDEEAKEDFNKWLVKTYNVELQSDRVISFTNGYYENNWISNCIALGMSSGFIEPLEATSIHVLVYQLERFCSVYNFTNNSYDQQTYNDDITSLYKNCFQYIRFFYDTNRVDSEFWRYMTNNKPEWLKDLNYKLEKDFYFKLPTSPKMFGESSFINIGSIHNKFKTSSIENFLINKHLYDRAKVANQIVQANKNNLEKSSVDHTAVIRSILDSINT